MALAKVRAWASKSSRTGTLVAVVGAAVVVMTSTLETWRPACKADYTSVLEQLTLAQFITSGAYDRHIRRRRLAYRRRRDALLRALARNVPAASATGIAAGLHALVTLPDGMSEQAAIARAARRGLTVGGLAAYRAGGQDHRPALVVGYATPPDHAYTGALARLTATLASV
jgi:GntR family transcriptional regulator / MocR family aminotransferase